MKSFYELGSGEKNLLASIDESNKYDYDISTFDCDFNRKNDSHIAIVNMLREESLVLDIGCATGLMGHLFTKYKNCTVDAIEYDKEAYKLAKDKNIYRNIYNFSILDKNNKNFLEIKKNKYDYIILADVLEHLVEPWEALCNIYDLLKDDGEIIISLPNIANLDIIRALVNDEFNYQYVGVVDTTHLRFFTKKSFVDMIKNIGDNYNVYYNVELLDTMKFTPLYHIDDEGFFSLFKLKNRNIDDFFVLQHIFKLTKSKKNKVLVKGIKNENDYFDVINNYIKEIHNENHNQEEMIMNLTKEKETFNLKYADLEKKYNKVVNSKGWRLLEKLRSIRKLFRRK